MALSPSDRALGDLLVGRRVITLPQLDEAVALAERGTCGSAMRCCRATGSIRDFTTRPTRRTSICRSSI
jgi:hypothetical protein